MNGELRWREFPREVPLITKETGIYRVIAKRSKDSDEVIVPVNHIRIIRDVYVPYRFWSLIPEIQY